MINRLNEILFIRSTVEFERKAENFPKVVICATQHTFASDQMDPWTVLLIISSSSNIWLCISPILLWLETPRGTNVVLCNRCLTNSHSYFTCVGFLNVISYIIIVINYYLTFCSIHKLNLPVSV